MHLEEYFMWKLIIKIIKICQLKFSKKKNYFLLKVKLTNMFTQYCAHVLFFIPINLYFNNEFIKTFIFH